MSSDLATVRRALGDSYDAIEQLCTGLEEAEWTTRSLCPEWDVRGVIVHLAGVEQAMAGWLPAGAEEPPPFERARAFGSETSGLAPRAFTTRVQEVFAVRRQDLAALRSEDLERPSWSPVGPADYGRFLDLRVFDFWVHERDVTTPLGRRSVDTGVRAEIALAEVERSLGYIVGKKVGFPDGASIVFHLTGPLERHLAVVVDGRARLVDHLEQPDVELTTDSVTFIQLAAGRIDPQAQIDAGKLRWSGDEELGQMAARNLAYTM